MVKVKRALLAAGLLIGMLVATWYAAVTQAPEARRRKAEQRARWQARARGNSPEPGSSA